MTKINGHELNERSNSDGYVRLSAALVNAACDFFFQRRGMSRSETGRFGFLPIARTRKYRDGRPRVVRIKLGDLSRAKKRRE